MKRIDLYTCILIAFLFIFFSTNGREITNIQKISGHNAAITDTQEVEDTFLTNENLDVLKNEEKPPHQQMLNSYLRDRVNKALDARKEQFEELIKTPESIHSYQKRMKQHFMDHLGGFPERTPLNTKTVDKKVYNDYRLEKVLYESQPGFYVSGLFYLPDPGASEPPYPGILVLCGHSEEGKAYPSYQKVCILLAKHGFAVLCPDPIGQGERKQILNNERKGKFPSTLEHNIEGVAPILMGENLATYMVWDAMRGIDYLVSHAEVDSSRIGCTVISGGGNRTSYMMALDERIDVASNGCFITTIRRKNESPGPGDAEQNIYGQIAFGMDHADYIHMRAPKPTLLLGATMDFVPIEGTWESFREAKRLYTRLGKPSNVSIIEAYEEHGYTRPLREATATWMLRWLKGIDQPVVEQTIPVETEEALQCTPQGQTLLMTGARSLFDLYKEQSQKLQSRRLEVWNSSGKNKILKKIRKITGIADLEDIPEPGFEWYDKIQRNGYQIDKVLLQITEKRAIPGLLFLPDVVKAEPCLYLHGEGKKTDAGPGAAIEQLVNNGHMVLAVDLTGFGETQMKPWRYTNAVPYLGNNLAEYFIAYMNGESFLGMRAEDILVSSRFLKGQYYGEIGNNKKVDVIAIGKAGPPAIHAVALEEDLFHSLKLQRSLNSWTDVVYTPLPRDIMGNVVHGTLRVYDLADLMSIIETPVVRVEDPVNAKRKLIQ